MNPVHELGDLGAVDYATQSNDSVDSPTAEMGYSKPPTKKRRKSRKGLEKAFECEEPNCGKKFTRMEHLARHQLNREFH